MEAASCAQTPLTGLEDWLVAETSGDVTELPSRDVTVQIRAALEYCRKSLRTHGTDCRHLELGNNWTDFIKSFI